MGRGIDLARPDAPEHAALMDELKDQLLLVLIDRLGGTIDIPVAEVDATGDKLLALRVDIDRPDPCFHFELQKKS